MSENSPRLQDEFTLRTSDVAQLTSLKPAKVNRYNTLGVIPEALRTQKQVNGLWLFKEDAVDWVEFAKKLTAWKITEPQMARFFTSAVSRCGTLASALASLNAAYERSRNFADMMKDFEANACVPGEGEESQATPAEEAVAKPAKSAKKPKEAAPTPEEAAPAQDDAPNASAAAST